MANEDTHHDPSQTNLDGPRVQNPRAVIDHPDPATPESLSTAAAVSVWATAQTSPAAQRKSRYVAESTAHPAKMLPAVAAHAITHYTQPGDLVLDPMCGIGTTLIEALHQDRRALGVEYEPHWVHITQANLDLARQNGIEHHGQVFHPRPRALLHGRITASGQAGLMSRRRVRVSASRSSFAGFRFPPDVIMIAVRWYLRYALSYRDVEELLAERGIKVDHVTIFRWVQHFTPLLIDAARPCRHAPGDRWFVDETVRREARCDRAGVRGLRRLAVAAAGLKLRAV